MVLLVAGPRVGATLAPTGPVEPEGELDGEVYAVVATSGSVGEPKGVILTRENVASAVKSSQARIGNDASDRWLLCLPLHHIAGLSVVWRSFAAGGTVVLHEAFDAAAVAAAFKGGEASMASLVPTMLARILDTDPGPYQGLRAVLVGGGPVRPELIERAFDAGLPALTTYGTTETTSQVATVAPGEGLAALGSVGTPLDGIEVSFEDGEILVDGPAVSPGYLGEAPRTGPHHTGDLGHLDDAGRLVVTGRKDGVILTGGEKVVPQAVEAVLEALPSVARAVVVGIRDPDWWEIVVAVVEGSATEAELDEAARAGLAVHQVPKRWVLVDALPELPSGKVDRLAAADLVART